MEVYTKKEQYISWKELKIRVEELKSLYPDCTFYGVPRGGSYIAALTGNPVDTPEEADVIVDDIIDSGATRKKYQLLYPDKTFDTAYVAEKNGMWIVFPWEQGAKSDLQDHIIRILEIMGYEPNDKNLHIISDHIKNGINDIKDKP